jgi:hypothetical protein
MFLRYATGISLTNLGLCERAQQEHNIPNVEKGGWSREVELPLKKVSSENGLGDASLQEDLNGHQVAVRPFWQF